MEIDIISDEENPLLNRRQIRFKAVFDGPTPSRAQVKSKIVALLNSDSDLTVLDKLETEYGKTSAIGYIKVYANADALKIERPHILERNKQPEKEEPEPAKEAEEGAKSEKTEDQASEPAKPEEEKPEGGVSE